MTKLLPSKRQWEKWSLPEKLTAIGTLAGVIALGLYIAEKSNVFLTDYFTPKEMPLLSIEVKFKYAKKEGKFFLNKENPYLVITNIGNKTIFPIKIDADMSNIDSKLSAITSYIAVGFETHGHLVFEPKLEAGKSIEQSLPGVRGWYKPAVYRVRVEMNSSSSNNYSIENCLFVVDSDSIDKEGREIDKAEANRLRSLVDSFLQSPDSKQKLILTAPEDGTWLPHPEPGVEMKLNDDGSITIQ